MEGQSERQFGDDISNVDAGSTDTERGYEKAKDPLLPEKKDDPRAGKVIKRKGAGRNTESFDPNSTLVRPDMRIIVGPNTDVYNGKLKHVSNPSSLAYV